MSGISGATVLLQGVSTCIILYLPNTNTSSHNLMKSVGSVTLHYVLEIAVDIFKANRLNQRLSAGKEKGSKTASFRTDYQADHHLSHVR